MLGNNSCKSSIVKESFKNAIFFYVHSIISYAIIFWDNTHSSSKIIRMQEKILRTITNSEKMDSCRELFKTMEILPFLYSVFIFTLLYMVNNKH